MKRLIGFGAALALFAGAPLPLAAAEMAGPNAVSFVAMGDMPYKIPDDYPRLEALIGTVNGLKPSFSMFVGDIKAGSAPCTDENILKIRDEFARFDQPLVYAIGDNEWTDCHREKAGKFDPMERLSKLREWFFAEPTSLGKEKMPLERQAEVMPEMKATDGKGFVENARFVKNNVLFVSLHIPGSNNNFEPRNVATTEEYFARNKANVAWIAASFEKAKATNAAAVVLGFQADLWDIRQTEEAIPVASGFVDTLKAIEKGAKDFGKPVLTINGDAHFFEVTPFYGTDMKPIANVTRLQVMGDSLVGAVRVVVDPDNAAMPFAFQPINEAVKPTN